MQSLLRVPVLLLLAAAGILLTLTACSGDDAPVAPTPAASPAAQTPTVATRPSPTPPSPTPTPPPLIIFDVETQNLLEPDSVEHARATSQLLPAETDPQAPAGLPANSQFSLSQDGTLVAVQLGSPIDKPEAVVVYRTDPLTELRRIESASLSGQFAVPSGIFAPDGSNVLVLFQPCTPEEHLASVNISTGTQKTLADGGFFQFVHSPDGRWVATTSGTSGGIVPADGSSPHTVVSDDVAAPATPRWSADSRYVGFTMFAGGYDRCV